MEWIPAVWNSLKTIFGTITVLKESLQVGQTTTSMTTGQVATVQNGLDNLRKYILGENPSEWPSLGSVSSMNDWIQRAVTDYNHVNEKVGVPLRKMEHVLKIVDPKGAWRMAENNNNVIMNLNWDALHQKGETDITLNHYLQMFEMFKDGFKNFIHSGCDRVDDYVSEADQIADQFGIANATLLSKKAAVIGGFLQDIGSGRMIAPYGQYCPSRCYSEAIPNYELDCNVGIGQADKTTLLGTWAHYGIMWYNLDETTPYPYGTDPKTLFESLSDKIAPSWNIKYLENNQQWVRPTWYDFKSQMNFRCGTMYANGANVKMKVAIIEWTGNNSSWEIIKIHSLDVEKVGDGEKMQEWYYHFDIDANESRKVMIFFYHAEVATTTLPASTFYFSIEFAGLSKIPNGSVVDYNEIFYINKDGLKVYLDSPTTSFVDLFGKMKITADVEMNFNAIMLWDELISGLEVDINNLIAIISGWMYARKFETIDCDASLQQFFGDNFHIKDLIPIQRWVYTGSCFDGAPDKVGGLLNLSSIFFEMSKWVLEDTECANYCLNILNSSDCCAMKTFRNKSNKGTFGKVMHSKAMIYKEMLQTKDRYRNNLINGTIKMPILKTKLEHDMMSLGAMLKAKNSTKK